MNKTLMQKDKVLNVQVQTPNKGAKAGRIKTTVQPYSNY